MVAATLHPLSGTVRWTLNAHKRGILGFDWSERHNVLVTYGLEREAYLFNPFTSRPVGIMRGHTASICHAIFNDADHQIITCAVDKVIHAYTPAPAPHSTLD